MSEKELEEERESLYQVILIQEFHYLENFSKQALVYGKDIVFLVSPGYIARVIRAQGIVKEADRRIQLIQAEQSRRLT
jgi:hypothetical protein